MTEVFAMIMGGGSSESLSVLTEVRSEPSVPFGGKFRLIDFPLSNCVNSAIFKVAVLTQYKPRSLNDHIGIGKPWDLDRASGGVRLLQPYRGGPYGDWQKGNADAVRRNLDYVDMDPNWRTAAKTGLYLLDGMEALSRVEADKHYPADVLMGMAVGNFLANFSFNLLLEEKNEQAVKLAIVPEGRGWKLELDRVW